MAGATAPWRLLGIAAPMAVWALHFVAAYGLQGLACARGWDRQAASATLLALAVPALVAVAWLGLRAWRTARAEREDRAAGRRRRFAALATALLSLLAAGAMVFTTVPVALLPPCA